MLLPLRGGTVRAILQSRDEGGAWSVESTGEAPINDDGPTTISLPLGRTAWLTPGMDGSKLIFTSAHKPQASTTVHTRRP
jgi:hypothetical protein